MQAFFLYVLTCILALGGYYFLCAYKKQLWHPIDFVAGMAMYTIGFLLGFFVAT